MDKKNIIISVLIIVLVVIGGSMFLIKENSVKKSAEIMNKIDKDIKLLDKYLDKYNYSDKGLVTINAKYRGAHGENYPSLYEYKFNLEKNNLYLENEEGYTNFEIDSNIYNLIKSLKSINVEKMVKIKKSSNKKIVLEEKLINKKLNTKYKSVYILINKDSYKVVLDDDFIEYYNDEYLIKFKNNNIKLNTNDIGYSLNINDKLKINAFVNKDTYSVVLNDFVYYIELKDDSIIFKASSESAIYNGLEMNFKFSDEVLNKNKEVDSINCPIVRYFEKVDTNFGVSK